jgi:hypothetical protein
LPQDRSELYGLLSLIVAIATLIVETYSIVAEKTTAGAIEATINEALREYTKQSEVPASRQAPDPGRDYWGWKSAVQDSISQQYVDARRGTAAYIAFAAPRGGLHTVIVPTPPPPGRNREYSRHLQIVYAVKLFVTRWLRMSGVAPTTWDEHSVFVFLLKPLARRPGEFSVQYRDIERRLPPPPGTPKLKKYKAFRLIRDKLAR